MNRMSGIVSRRRGNGRRCASESSGNWDQPGRTGGAGGPVGADCVNCGALAATGLAAGTPSAFVGVVRLGATGGVFCGGCGSGSEGMLMIVNRTKTLPGGVVGKEGA